MEFSYRRLMFTTFVISGCSMIYELLISAVSSYLLGDSVAQFSITIGIYMCAMGLGSYLSKYVKKNLFDWFIFVEIGVGILGGSSALILFLANIYLSSYQIIMYSEIIMIGVLVGLEIPLLTRIIEENCGNLRLTLSNIFSFDYIGGLVGSIAFPLLLLPQLGYFTTSYMVGFINLLIAMFILFSYKSYIKNFTNWKLVAFFFGGIMILGMIFSEDIAGGIENGLYRDKVIYYDQTPYQKLVITKHKDDVRLFINGNLQFCSTDEYRYHESLVHIPMMSANRHDNILVLGGGDGLAVREIAKYPDVKNITLVDLDPDIIELCRTHSDIAKLNKNALDNSRLKIINTDAYRFLEENNNLPDAVKYDVIIVDLPDPNSETLNKLYTNLFYRLCYNNLNENGVMSVQSTSPYYATDAYWCINKTINSEFASVYPYHAQVPSFGDWGFQLAFKSKTDSLKILDDFNPDFTCRFLTKDNINSLFQFAQDETSTNEDLYVNSLSTPKLLQYYLKAEANWN